MNLSDFLDVELIALDLQGQDKPQILSNLVGLLHGRGLIKHPQRLVAALLEREGLGSTGVGHAVAIPHGRSQEVDRPAIAFGRTRHDVDYDAIDGEPTRLFFLLVAPENGTNEHLHLLARVARLMRDAKTRELLLAMEDRQAVLDLLTAGETP